MRVGGRGTMDETERPREPSPNHREEDSEPSASAIAQDATFCAAMRRAIEKGLERAPIGVDRRPGTKRPIFIPAGSAWAQPCRNAKPAPARAPTTRPPSPSQTLVRTSEWSTVERQRLDRTDFTTY